MPDPCQGRKDCTNEVEVYVEWTEIAASWPDQPTDWASFVCNDCCGVLREGRAWICDEFGGCTDDHKVTVTAYRSIRLHRERVRAAAPSGGSQ